MADIYWGLSIISSVAVGAFFLTLVATRRLSRLVDDGVALLVVVAIFTYIRFVWYNPRLVSWLPVSNLIIVGNWFPIGAAILGGLAWRRMPGRIYRKSIVVGALACTSVYSLVCPLLGDLPQCLEVWNDDICVQTTARTCTPACAATLLRAHGIDASEREMTKLCLTRSGTTWLGLYHGLKAKTKGTPWDVEVISCDVSQLLQEPVSPMILSVGLPAIEAGNRQLAMNEWGWKRGIGHSVIMLPGAKEGAAVRIVDPTPGVGYESWAIGDIQYLFRGMAIRLVKRS
jgi:hypothetical protein